MKMWRAAVAFAASALMLAQGAQARPWRLADLGAFTFLTGPQLAPDGKTALLDVQRIDLPRMRFEDREYVVDMTSGAMRPLLAGASMPVENPRWSPDGRRIAFITQARGARALAIVSASGGMPRTLVSANVVRFAWSPDGTRIAATESAPKMQAADEPLSMFVNPDVTIDAADIPAQRTLWIVDAASGEQRLLARDTYSYGGPETDHDPSWSADGRKIAVVRQPNPFYAAFEHAQYVALDSASGAVSQLVSGPFFAYPATAPPVYAPRGESIAYMHTWDGKLASRQDVYVDGRDRSAPLERDFWSCGGAVMAWRGNHVLASALDGVAMRIFDMAPNGDIAPLTPPDGSVEDFSVSASGRIAAVYSTPERLPELYEVTSSGLRQVTHLSNLPADLDVAKTELLTWPDGAGHTLEGQVTLPRNPRGAPVVVNPHGGPQCADDNSLNPFAQYFATNGYVFFRPNPRGSDGYGDWSYKAIVENWGEIPMSDDMAGIDAMLARGYGDPAKLFLDGASYGGYLTSWMVTHTNRFRAAVAEVPVTDLRLDYTLTESPNITRRFFGMRPVADNSDALERESPLHYAGNMNTPLLIISGLRDTRAPYPQALEFYKALLDNGKDARMLVYPKAGHGPSDPAGILDDLRHAAGWLAAHGGIMTPGAIPPAK